MSIRFCHKGKATLLLGSDYTQDPIPIILAYAKGAVMYEPHTRTKSNLHYDLLLCFWFHRTIHSRENEKRIALRVAFIYRLTIYILNVTVMKILLNCEVQR